MVRTGFYRVSNATVRTAVEIFCAVLTLVQTGASPLEFPYENISIKKIPDVKRA